MYQKIAGWWFVSQFHWILINYSFIMFVPLQPEKSGAPMWSSTPPRRKWPRKPKWSWTLLAAPMPTRPDWRRIDHRTADCGRMVKHGETPWWRWHAHKANIKNACLDARHEKPRAHFDTSLSNFFKEPECESPKPGFLGNCRIYHSNSFNMFFNMFSHLKTNISQTCPVSQALPVVDACASNGCCYVDAVFRKRRRTGPLGVVGSPDVTGFTWQGLAKLKYAISI